MDEYVSKEEVVLALLDKGQQTTRYKLGESWELNLFEIREAVVNMESADVEPVRHGRWIECDYKRLEHGMIETYPNAGYACSVCRTGFEKKKMTYKQYCSHCGAKMDGGDEDEAD